MDKAVETRNAPTYSTNKITLGEKRTRGSVAGPVVYTKIGSKSRREKQLNCKLSTNQILITGLSTKLHSRLSNTSITTEMPESSTMDQRVTAMWRHSLWFSVRHTTKRKERKGVFKFQMIP